MTDLIHAKKREQSKVISSRREQLVRCIPGIWNYKKVLNIGANDKMFAFCSDFKQHGCIVDVIEIYPEYCQGLRKHFDWLNQIVCGSVVDIDKLVEKGELEKKYELVIWSHGPGTLHDKQLIFDTLDELYLMTEKVLVIMNAYGKRRYVERNREKLETDYITKNDFMDIVLYEDDFKKRDFLVDVLGEKDGDQSNLLAWKYSNVA